MENFNILDFVTKEKAPSQDVSKSPTNEHWRTANHIGILKAACSEPKAVWSDRAL